MIKQNSPEKQVIGTPENEGCKFDGRITAIKKI